MNSRIPATAKKIHRTKRRRPAMKCPHCGSTRHWRRGTRPGAFKCRDCRREFRRNRTLPLYLAAEKWLSLLRWFSRGFSARRIAEKASLHPQRVLRALAVVRETILESGDVQFRETVHYLTDRIGRAEQHGRLADFGGTEAEETYQDEFWKVSDRIALHGLGYALRKPQEILRLLRRWIGKKRGVRQIHRRGYVAEFVWRIQHEHKGPRRMAEKLIEMVQHA